MSAERAHGAVTGSSTGPALEDPAANPERPLRGETTIRLVSLYRQHHKGSVGIRCHHGHADCGCTVVAGMDGRAECAEDVITELATRGVFVGSALRHKLIGPVSAPGTSGPVPILSAHDEFIAKEALRALEDGTPLRGEHRRCLMAYVTYLEADRDRWLARVEAQRASQDGAAQSNASMAAMRVVAASLDVDAPMGRGVVAHG